MSGDILIGDIDLVPPSEWSIRGVIGGLSVLWGPEGSYKTFLSIGMAVSVAGGVPWFGCEVAQGPVLYILGEGGVDLFRRRAGEAARIRGLSVRELPIWIRGEALDLSTPKHLERHYGNWDQISPSLVIVDTLSRCMPGDENSQEAMQGFVNSMDTLRDRYQANVLVIHHEGRTAGRVRGSTVLPGAVDVSIRAHRDPNTRTLHLSPKKLRDLDTESFAHPKLYAEKVNIKDEWDNLMMDEFGDLVTTLVIREHKSHTVTVTKVVDSFATLKSNRDPSAWVGYKEWLEASTLPPSSFKRGLSTVLNSPSEYGIVPMRRGQYNYQVDSANPFVGGTEGENYAYEREDD